MVRATDLATGKTYRVHVQARVTGWERVRVPAGEFDALRVQRYVYAGNYYLVSVLTGGRYHVVRYAKGKPRSLTSGIQTSGAGTAESGTSDSATTRGS